MRVSHTPNSDRRFRHGTRSNVETTSLRFTGWFDPYVGSEYPRGAYVHYCCLSTERLTEISLLDAKDKEAADRRRLSANATTTR